MSNIKSASAGLAGTKAQAVRSKMIILIGPIPPPIHGASLITQRVAERIVANNLALLQCSTSPRQGAVGLAYHLSRLRNYLRCCRMVVRRRENKEDTAVYLSLSGGFGLLYDLLVVAATRFKRCKIVFHHHSFAYINNPSRIMQFIVWMAGASQLHIVLCPTMALRFAEQYGSWLKIAVISNLLFFDVHEGPMRPPPERLAVIGYLSSLSFGKGVDRYLDIFTSLRARGSRVAGIMAGSFENSETQEYVERRIREIGDIEYWGPIFGEQKKSFFSSVDLLVFPSRYGNEAEPLVVYEAQVAGIPVVASNRGCLAEPVKASSLYLLDSMADNLGTLIEQIVIWEKDPSSFQLVAQRFRDEFSVLLELRNEDAKTFHTLFSGRE